MRLKLFSAILPLFWYTGSALAADLFQLTVNGETRSYSSVDELPDYNTMQQQFTSVSNWNADALSIELNYRGIDLTANFSANDDEVVFIIPSLNKTWSYEGTSRQGSWTQLTDALVQESDLVNDLLGLMVLYTPNDPVAGNPSSLMDNFVRLDFSAVLVDLPLGNALQGGASRVEAAPLADADGMAVDESDSSVSSASPEVTEGEETEESSTETSERENKIGIGLGFSSYDQGDSKVNTTTIPFSYSWNFEGESKSSLTLRLPISQIDVDGNAGIAAGLGLNYRQFVSPNWQLSPSLNYGVTASEALGSGGALASYSILSIYDWTASWGAIRIGNQAGQYRSMPLSVGGTTFDAGIESTVLRNGLIFQFPTGFIRDGATFDPYLLDTRYYGTELYIMQYYEMGFTLSGWVFLSSSLTFNYLVAEDDKAKGTSFLFKAQF
ncbi:MAG: hypothetical protein VXW13_07045 [SAR324 cluster bacterium]|nr:hypothetical protein [SAR324 cluster bacterium]